MTPRIPGLLPSAARAVTRALGHESPLVRAARPAYDWLLERLSGGRGLPWSVNGVPCHIAPRLRARLPREYEPGAARFLASRVRPGDVCLDVGANVGAYVLQLAHWSRPGGRIIAFEPSPAAAAILTHHVRLNGLAERVEIVRAAVGAEPGTATMHVAGADGRGRLGVEHPELAGRTETLQVPVTTIDQYCGAHGIMPAWILIDIEGFEIAALRGAGRTLAAEPPPGVVVELHPSAWPLSGTSRAEAETLLEELGLAPVPLTASGDPLATHGIVHLARTARGPGA
jgi:FkbM family methyltransferase